MSDVIRLNLMLIAGGFFHFILTVSFIKKIKVGVKNSNNAEIINGPLTSRATVCYSVARVETN